MALSPREKIQFKKIIDKNFEKLESDTKLTPREKIALKREIENAFAKLEEAMEISPEAAMENEKLARLKAGDYDSLSPADFIKILREIVDEINDIEQVKVPAVKYIDKRVKKA